MLSRPPALNLSNWRQPPHGRWAFHHVGEIIPTVVIARGAQSSQLHRAIDGRVADLMVSGPDGLPWSLAQWLEASSSDALLVAHRGKLVHEWYAHGEIETAPHIVFSVSKSITATLAGILQQQALIDCDSLLSDIIPQLADSGFAGASLQQLLDMQINLDFEEDYEATAGKFIEYRRASGWYPCGLEDLDVNLHDFLLSLKQGKGAHGSVFAYKSPNTDLLGWILERVGGDSLNKLLSQQLWQPMGAEADAWITLDRKGGPRSAGGICLRPRDLLRFGELIRNRGYANGRQIVAQSWVEDCSHGGDRAAWLRSESSERFPDGNYRNQWYQSGNRNQAMLAIGIHSQWVYIDPVAEVSIVKLSAQDSPLNPQLGPINLSAFATISDLF